MSNDQPAIPLLATLPPEARGVLLPLFRPRQLGRDETVFFEGDPAEVLYVVGSGKIKLLKHSDAGKDIVLEVVAAGDTFGELGILDGGVYPVSAQAMEQGMVWGIRRSDYLNLLRQYPALGLAVAQSLGKRLRDAYEMMLSLAVERVERRIARVLLKLAAATGQRTKEGILIGTPLTRQDIADMTGTTVETAIRVMSRFSKRGIIRSRRGRVVLAEPHQLVVIAEEV